MLNTLLFSRLKYRHSTLVTIKSLNTLSSLMINHIHSSHFFPTVMALDHNERTCILMIQNVKLRTLSPALLECIALYNFILTVTLVSHHLVIFQYCLASLVYTIKLYRFQLGLYLRLDAAKLGFVTHRRTLFCLCQKFSKTYRMKAGFTF